MATQPDPNADPAAPPPAGPPFYFRRVRIRNYKSIAFCDVTLEPFTVLVGRNGAGKSNFLDALEFVRDFVTLGLTQAVSLHGGRDNLVHRKADPAGEFSIEVEADFDLLRCPHAAATYHLTVGGLRRHERPGVRSEWLRIADADGVVDRSYVRPAAPAGDGQEGNGPASRLAEDESHLRYASRGADGRVPGRVATALMMTRFFNISPPAVRRPRPADGGAPLDRDGGNLADLLDEDMAAGAGPTFERLKDYLRAAVPQVRDVRAVPLQSDRLTLQFAVAAGGNTMERFDATQVSDGTLRALAALTAAFHPDPFGYTSAVGIEEPDLAVHPAAAKVLVAAFAEAALQRQVLITTHSPDLLDAEEVTPENVRVVQFVGGETVIGPVDRVSREVVKRHLNTLGELESEDSLTVDPGDLERQQDLLRRLSR